MSDWRDGLLAGRNLRDLPLARQRMRDRIAGLGVSSRILDAMDAVPRHAFLPAAYWRLAYAEAGLWLPTGTDLPAPEATARILDALAPGDADRLLEIGTGTGYLAALLGRLAGSVLTVDTADLTDGALAAARLANVRQLVGTRAAAWRSEGPFDAILIGRPVPVPPVALLSLARRLVVVAGPTRGPQRLLLARPGDTGEGVRVTDAGPIFVPDPAMACAVTGSVPSAFMAMGASDLAATLEGDDVSEGQGP